MTRSEYGVTLAPLARAARTATGSAPILFAHVTHVGPSARDLDMAGRARLDFIGRKACIHMHSSSVEASRPFAHASESPSTFATGWTPLQSQSKFSADEIISMAAIVIGYTDL